MCGKHCIDLGPSKWIRLSLLKYDLENNKVILLLTLFLVSLNIVTFSGKLMQSIFLTLCDTPKVKLGPSRASF